MNLNNCQDCFMNDFMEDDIKIFVTGLKKASKIKRVNQTSLADCIGVDQTTISNYFNFKTRPKPEHLDAFSARIGMTVDEILEIGRKELSPQLSDETKIKEIVKAVISEQQQPTPPNVAKYERNKEHHETVDRFKDQKTALEINHALVEIESLDPNALERICATLKTELGILRNKKTPEQTDQGGRNTKRG